MLKLRFLKQKLGSSYQLLETATIPEIENLQDLGVIIFSIGKMIKGYTESFTDPNIVTACLNKDYDNWIVSDLESILSVINESKYRLVISRYDEEIEELNEGYEYLILDGSVKQLGFIPEELSIKKKDINSQTILEVYKELFQDGSYYRKDRFVSNPINNLIERLEESFQLLQTLDPSALAAMGRKLVEFNKELLIISKV
jgi:hypothetical protein